MLASSSLLHSTSLLTSCTCSCRVFCMRYCWLCYQSCILWVSSTMPRETLLLLCSKSLYSQKVHQGYFVVLFVCYVHAVVNDINFIREKKDVCRQFMYLCNRHLFQIWAVCFTIPYGSLRASSVQWHHWHFNHDGIAAATNRCLLWPYAANAGRNDPRVNAAHRGPSHDTLD